MYAKLLEVLGDEPSAEGYYADQAKGLLGERAERWRSTFATAARATSGSSGCAPRASPCEPVFGPGEALSDPHLAEIGLAVPRSDDDGHDDRDGVVLATPIAVRPGPRRRPTRPGDAGYLAAGEAYRRAQSRRRRLLGGRAGARLLGVRGRARSPPRCSPTSAPR